MIEAVAFPPFLSAENAETRVSSRMEEKVDVMTATKRLMSQYWRTTRETMKKMHAAYPSVSIIAYITTVQVLADATTTT